MQIRSNSEIYKCWSSARSRGTFIGDLDDFINTVGHHPGHGMELRRKNVKEPLTSGNFEWVLPRPKDEVIMACITEGENAKAGSKCPYKDGDIGKRCAWLAGHYDRYGKEAWLKAGRY